MLLSIFQDDTPLIKKLESDLYKEHYKTVFRTVHYYIRSVELSKDLTNEAFLVSFEKLHTLKDISKFKSWITVIATNLSKQYLKKNNKLYFVEDYNNLNIPTETFENEVIDKMDQIDKLNSVKEALTIVNHEYKEVLLLRYYQKLSYSEIAEKLSVSIGTIKSRLFRAKHEIFTIISEKEGEKNA